MERHRIEIGDEQECCYLGKRLQCTTLEVDGRIGQQHHGAAEEAECVVVDRTVPPLPIIIIVIIIKRIYRDLCRFRCYLGCSKLVGAAVGVKVDLLELSIPHSAAVARIGKSGNTVADQLGFARLLSPAAIVPFLYSSKRHGR